MLKNDEEKYEHALSVTSRESERESRNEMNVG
jgi:hypothetical protein